MELLCFLVFSICLLFSLSRISSAADTITSSQSLSDGKSLVSSPGGIFELGFFSPGISKSRYLGIWYKNIPTPTVVWVANRQTPINGSTGSLMINSTGNLVLVNNNNQTVWSTNSSKQSQSQRPVLQLLDNGNLVLRDEKDANSENYLWQSFDYPSDTLLPGMKLGWDLRTGLNRRLTAWKSPDDPSSGDFIWEMELHEYPEPVMWKGSKEYLRSGPWNGVLFSGKPAKALPALNFSFISNEDEVYLTIDMVNKSVLGRMIMNQTTSTPYRQEWIWSEADRNWTIYATFPRDPCDSYGHCGGNGNCVLSSSPICQCLDRFSPRSPENWNLNEFSQGCERRKPLNCKNDGFATYPGLKLPDTTHSWVDKSMNLKECRAKCLSNCSCSAYTNLDVRGGGSGCAIWFDDLVDIKQMPGGDQDIYIKISASELGGKDEKWKIAVIIASASALILGMLLVGYCCILKARGRKNVKGKDIEEQKDEDLELPLFDLTTIEGATNFFSVPNSLHTKPSSDTHIKVEEKWLGFTALGRKPTHLKLSNGCRARAALNADPRSIEIPHQWYNLIADLPVKPPPPLHPKTFEPVKPEDLSPLFPDELIKQEASNERFIDIPDEVRDVYRLWRPSPLIRAKRLEKLLDTPARIYYKYEGVSPAGSHKPNTAVPQVWYNAQQGIKKVVTETGAGQWGSALAFACSLFGLECEVWQVRASYDQKPYRRLMMQTWGAKVHPSPSNLTEAGRKILQMDPSSPGSLGIAISEAVEIAAMNADTKYCLGSVLNHVLHHQTVIGEECLKQMEAIGETPDFIIGCTGGGSNFAGLSFPFIREKLKGKMNPVIRAVEPAACPSLTKGVYTYDYGDTAGMTPLMKMHTLGHDFIPDPIHAGGLRYHGMAPLISHVYELGYMEAIAIPQIECFEGAIQFARSEGLIPAPEPTHAIAATIREALNCRETGEAKVILTAMCGHGHFDLPAYDNYLQGKLVDLSFEEEKIQASLARVPKVGG